MITEEREPPPPPPEYWPEGYLDPPGCTHGCMAWHTVPDSITKPYGFEDVGGLFLAGEPPNYKVCAKPGNLPREEPWCYCPGPLAGWAYCERVAVNCSLQPRVPDPDSVEASSCAHRNNLCGVWNMPCRKAVMQESSKLYYAESTQYTTDGAFRQQLKASMSLEECEAKQYFMEMELRGSWRHERASKHLNDTSMITTEVTQAWLQIIKEEICQEDQGYIKDDGPPTCFNTSYVMRDLCPCNGWPFIMDGDFVRRNIVMFCRPSRECPLLMDQIVKRPRFTLYNASRKAVCWYRPDATPTVGWGQGLTKEEFKPAPPVCVFKEKHDDCLDTNAFMNGVGGVALVWLAIMTQW